MIHKIWKSLIIVFFLSNIMFAQNSYYVSNSGSDGNSGTESNPWKTISKVNSVKFNSGDKIFFKGEDKFDDAALKVDDAETYYSSYGQGKAVIGDSLGSLFNTIEVTASGVTLENLFIYGSGLKQSRSAAIYISSTGNDLAVSNCTLRGGKGSTYIGRGINNIRAEGLTVEYNDISYFTQAIALNYGKNIEIAYNTIHHIMRWDNWTDVTLGKKNFGGMGIFLTVDDPYNDGAWDYEYTLEVHHNEFYKWEHSVIVGMAASNWIFEYNEIHNPLDERIYRGALGHAYVGKISDDQGINPSVHTGGTGMVLRYNYIHDLILYGKPNYTYGDGGVVVSTNNGYGRPVYLGSDFDGSDFGVDPWDKLSAGVFGGGGHAHTFIHNNIIYNVAHGAYRRGRGEAETWRDDMYSVFAYNTVYNSLTAEFYTNAIIGVPVSGVYSPSYWQNNVLHSKSQNFVGGFFKEDSKVSHNVWVNRKGYSLGRSQPSSEYAHWQVYGHRIDAEEDIKTEMYNQDPGFQNIEEKIFLPNVGPEGVWVPNFMLSESSELIGKAVKVGEDPTGVSMDGFDIMGNRRDDNPDIGAFEYSADATPPPSSFVNVKLKLFLEGSYNNGGMISVLNDAIVLPEVQPYSAEPWNYSGGEKVNSLPEDFIDWVLIELRNADQSAAARRAAVLLSDGSVVDIDGKNEIKFENVSSGEYFVTVIHRNHLSVMSAEAVSLSENSPLYDFTAAQESAYGETPLKNLGGGVFGLFSGDGNSDGVVNVLDYGEIANNIYKSGYYRGDVNMDSVVNDKDYDNTNLNLFNASSVPENTAAKGANIK